MPDSGAPTHGDVFVNCPFDSDYKQQFNALIFTIYDCGFYPRCALEAVDSGQLRFQKICHLILESPYGIHDLYYYGLKLENPLDFAPSSNSKMADTEVRQPNVTEVQLVETTYFIPLLNELQGVQVSLVGNFIGRHTVHHVRPVLFALKGDTIRDTKGFSVFPRSKTQIIASKRNSRVMVVR